MVANHNVAAPLSVQDPSLALRRGEGLPSASHPRDAAYCQHYLTTCYHYHVLAVEMFV